MILQVNGGGSWTSSPRGDGGMIGWDGVKEQGQNCHFNIFGLIVQQLLDFNLNYLLILLIYLMIMKVAPPVEHSFDTSP